MWDLVSTCRLGDKRKIDCTPLMPNGSTGVFEAESFAVEVLSGTGVVVGTSEDPSLSFEWKPIEFGTTLFLVSVELDLGDGAVILTATVCGEALPALDSAIVLVESTETPLTSAASRALHEKYRV